MFKKLISFVLCALIVITVFPVPSLAGAPTVDSVIELARKTASNNEIEFKQKAMWEQWDAHIELLKCDAIFGLLDTMGELSAYTIRAMIKDPTVVEDALNSYNTYNIKYLQFIADHLFSIFAYEQFREADAMYNQALSYEAGGINDYRTAVAFLDCFYKAQTYYEPGATIIDDDTDYNLADNIMGTAQAFVSGLIPGAPSLKNIKTVYEAIDQTNTLIKMYTGCDNYIKYLDAYADALSQYNKIAKKYFHLDDGGTDTDDTSVPAPSVPCLAYPEMGSICKRFPSLGWSGGSDYNGNTCAYIVEIYNGAGKRLVICTVYSRTWSPEGYDLGDESYQWRVNARDAVGNESGWSDYWQFTVNSKMGAAAPQAPALTNPSNGYTVSTGVPTLRWNSVSSPSGGQVKYYAETFDCPSPENSGWVTGTSWTPNATIGGLYNWHVKAIDMGTGKESGYGDVWQYTIAVEYQPPSTPLLSSPSNGSSFTGSSPTLRWNTVSSPSGGQVKYYAETFDCPSSQNSGWITGTSWAPSSAMAGLYNWHVKAIDVNTGKETGYGSVWQYTIVTEYQPPGKPSLSSPSNGSTFTGSSPTLWWNSVSSPSGGQVKYYAETYDCPTPQNSGWITGTSWTPSATAVGLYNWHIKSVDMNTGKESGYGSVWQYTIAAEYQPPGKPSLSSPSNGSTFTGSAPTLWWNNVSSPSGGQVKYYVETFDCPSPQNSGWIADTSWSPSATALGLYNWHVKAIDVNTGKESGYGVVWQYTIAAEYQPPDKPSLLSPGSGSTFTGSTPTLQWTSVSSSSGGQVKYYAETFDCPSPQNSGWITGTSWSPGATAIGLYNWHVKAIDMNTGKETGYGVVWQYTLKASSDSTNLPLDIRIAKFGPYDAQSNYSDQTQKVREMISNNSVSITATDSFFFTAGDPGPSFTKTLIVIYRNRWNEEWQVSCSEGQTITINRDSRVGTFLLDGDNQ